jgi:predicted nucleotidyltransferase
MDSKNKRIENMDKTVDKSIKDYISLILEKFSNIKEVYIFGSQVNGNPKSESDIDLAIIFEEMDDSERFELQVQLMMLASQIDSRIEPHPISLSEFQSGNPFAVEIRKTGLEILKEAS